MLNLNMCSLKGRDFLYNLTEITNMASKNIQL